MLGQLKPGDKSRIIDMTKADRLVRRRLLDLGIMEGSEICIKCMMPFGGPLMVESVRQCVGIRLSEACKIKVEKL
jgi:ferrous iron transport protein A